MGDMSRLPVVFACRSLDDLREFPIEIRRYAGYQIDKLQAGLAPDDWRSMWSIGPGVQEIRVAERGNRFPVLYILRFQATIYVLHCVLKNTRNVARRDVHHARAVLHALLTAPEA